MKKRKLLKMLNDFFADDLSQRNVELRCKYKALNHFETLIVYEFIRGVSIKEMAVRFNYDKKELTKKIEQCVKRLTA